jgi:predicted RecB family nuclease
MAAPITPTSIAQARECLHFYYLEGFGDRSNFVPISAGDALRIEQGVLFEKEVVSRIPGVITVPWKHPDFKDGYEKTLELMRKGTPWIHSGVLMSEGMLGVPDLLKRVERASKLGDFSYEPVDIKSHQKILSTDILQVYGYARLLEPLLGYRPPAGGVWLAGGSLERIFFDPTTVHDFDRVVGQMALTNAGKLRTEPSRCSACGACAWIGQCNSDWIRTDHVSLLPGVGESLVRKLKAVGITTCKQVSQADPAVLTGQLCAKPHVMDRLVHSARSRVDNKPYVLSPLPDVGDVPIYFYDIETYGPITVLHGAIRLYRGEREERSFFAESLDGEEKIWHDFLDYIARDTKAVIYCWTMFEQSHAYGLWDRYGGNEAGYKLLIENLVDQCALTKRHFVLPCRGYSIKVVAPVFNFYWHAADAGGGNCEAWYGQYLQTRDKALHDKIIEYNLDDVRAMDVIYQATTKLSRGV